MYDEAMDFTWPATRVWNDARPMRFPKVMSNAFISGQTYHLLRVFKGGVVHNIAHHNNLQLHRGCTL